MRRCGRPNGFTFVETMIVLALFSIISMAILSSFTTGMRVWRWATSPKVAYGRAALGFERLCTELRRAVNYPPIGFWGEMDSVTFANVFNGKILNITYRLDQDQGAVIRQASALTSLGDEAAEGPARPVIRSVKNVRLGYYGVIEPRTRQMGFLDAWNYSRSGIPPYVRLTVTWTNDNVSETLVPILIQY